ncbi:hypothetical protein HPB47_012144 [Ixodes persulcatus]|uniref:Uncharacterized protein n=1 Tax=Ixodes persulcatus TaxID=34615 RepID=A0AC60NUA0_IXOPE|nr:hypothetical protein HPB47_012144 [Ixodes persulcatus]
MKQQYLCSTVAGVARAWPGPDGPDASRVWPGPGPGPAEAYATRPGPGPRAGPGPGFQQCVVPVRRSRLMAPGGAWQCCYYPAACLLWPPRALVSVRTRPTYASGDC